MAVHLLSEPIALVTGFDAFGGLLRNPSGCAAQALHGRTVAGHRIVGALLPTAFEASLRMLLDLVEMHDPALVLCTGLAASRHAFSLERVAINLVDAEYADNHGAQPVDAPVIPRAPAAYFSTLPLRPMQAALLREGVPVELSLSAGTFVCNHVFYGLMHALAAQPQWRGVRGGFVHVPSLETMSLPALVQGLQVMLAAALSEARPAAGPARLR